MRRIKRTDHAALWTDERAKEVKPPELTPVQRGREAIRAALGAHDSLVFHVDPELLSSDFSMLEQQIGAALAESMRFMLLYGTSVAPRASDTARPAPDPRPYWPMLQSSRLSQEAPNAQVTVPRGLSRGELIMQVARPRPVNRGRIAVDLEEDISPSWTTFIVDESNRVIHGHARLRAMQRLERRERNHVGVGTVHPAGPRAERRGQKLQDHTIPKYHAEKLKHGKERAAVSPLLKSLTRKL